jgi:hypothetical protein
MTWSLCISVQGTEVNRFLLAGFKEGTGHVFSLAHRHTSNKHVVLYIKISGDKIETVTF